MMSSVNLPDFIQDKDANSDSGSSTNNYGETFSDSREEKSVKNLTRKGLYLAGTESQYRSYLRKFAEFIGIEFHADQPIPKEYYTDSNIAAWFEELYKTGKPGVRFIN